MKTKSMENSVKKGIARGDYSVKQHLANGAKTMCRRNSLHANESQSFLWWATKYPEACCIACLNYVKQRGLI